MKTLAPTILAAVLAAGLTAPAMAATYISPVPLAPGAGDAHTFTPARGTFTDYLQFALAPSASGVLSSLVSLQLSSIFNISSLSGNLYQGAFSDLSPVPLAAPSLGSVSAGSTDVLIGGLSTGAYTFVYTGNATGSNGGIYTAAVAAVPEAHEWAMMLSGLGLLAFVVSRRRKSAALAAA